MSNKTLLPIIAFTSGFALMTFELIAARILAPSIGSSTYIWTSVIGVIIAALSVGYFVGGRLADTRHQLSDICWLLLATAFTVCAALLFYPSFIAAVTDTIVDVRLQGVVASLLLFAPMSFLIGMLNPYLVKLQITSLETSGRSFASLSVLESIGGITGTFVTGFILFGFIGVRESLVVVVALLVAASWLAVPRQHLRGRIAASLVIACAAWIGVSVHEPGQIETPSSHYSIINGVLNNRQVRGLATGPEGTQSGVYIDQPDELLFWYTQRLAEITAAAPSQKRILVLGGGALTLPRYFASEYPDSKIDVVEIDPELLTIARHQFFYDDPPQVTFIADDARSYVKTTTKTYDVVLVDVYSDASVPFSLMTEEYGKQLRAVVAPNGVVGVNMIAGTTGACGQLLGALDAPYRQHWPSAFYLQESSTPQRSNLVVAYSEAPLQLPTAQKLSLSGKTIYTDNFAPAERLQQACRQAG